MFTTSILKRKDSKLESVQDRTWCRSHAFCPHAARVRVHWTYDVRYIHIYIYQKNSAVQLTSVGLAQARPNQKNSAVQLTSVGLAQARPNQKNSAVQLTSVGLAQARPNYTYT